MHLKGRTFARKGLIFPPKRGGGKNTSSKRGKEKREKKRNRRMASREGRSRYFMRVPFAQAWEGDRALGPFFG